MAWALDVALIAGSIFAALYLTLNLDAIVNRAGAWSATDVFAGVVAIVTLLEASRRTVGWPISFIAACFIGYAYAGPALPGVLRHGGYSTGRMVGQLYLGQEGIYGIPLGVAASFVFIFILFGALLEVTDAGRGGGPLKPRFWPPRRWDPCRGVPSQTWSRAVHSQFRS